MLVLSTILGHRDEAVSALYAEKIADDLRHRIRQRTLLPGDTINQKLIAAELGVSRIPVREALQALGSEGLVTLTPGKGATVIELDRDDIEDLYDLRLALEPRLAPDVVGSLSPRDHARLRELNTLMHRARSQMDGDRDVHREQWSHWNRDFHQFMYIATGRTYAVRVVLQLMDLVEPYSRLYVHVLGAVDRATAEHDAMIEAIESQREHDLADLLSAHLDSARRELLDDRWWEHGHFVGPDPERGRNE